MNDVRTNPVEIEVSEMGVKKLLVGGEDVSDEVSGVGFTVEPGRPPVVNLRLAAPEAIKLKGHAVIQVIESRPDPELIVQFLSSIDPKILEGLALEGLDYGGASPMESALKVLISIAKGEV